MGGGRTAKLKNDSVREGEREREEEEKEGESKKWGG